MFDLEYTDENGRHRIQAGQTARTAYVTAKWLIAKYRATNIWLIDQAKGESRRLKQQGGHLVCV